MAEQAKVAPDQEPVVDPAKPDAVEPPEKKPDGAKKEETIGEALNVEPTVEEPEEKVPLSALLDVKKENKQLQKDMKALKKQIEEGATPKEVSTSIDALMEEYPETDREFIQKLAQTIRAEVKKETAGEVTEALKPIKEKDRAAEIDKRFNTHFVNAMEAMPEYKDVVDKDTIKALSLLPQNANKTFTQLIEASYGHLVTGKRTIDAGSTRAGKPDGEIDFKRAESDTAYFDQIMADPGMKKKYNERLVGKLSSAL